MNKKAIFTSVAILFSVMGIFAGNNERGIDLYRAELYPAAKIFFLEQRNQSGMEQAENQYYLGQTYAALQQLDSAAYYYDQSITTAPEYPFGYIGEGQLALLKKDAKSADVSFKKALALAPKKDASIATAIAEVYIQAGMYPQAEEAILKAEKANKKYSGIFLAKGDMALKQGKRDQAYQWYEQAKYFNANDKLAYLKLGKAYENTQSGAPALEYLNQLVAIDPDYIPAYALIGDINRDNGRYNQALAAYEKFISIPGVPILQHERYAQILYFTDQYQKSLDRINYILKYDPNNPVMHRLLGYNHFKLDETALAAQEMEQFLANNPVEKHIYLDYITYGRALVKEKQSEKAIEVLLKAAELDPDKVEVYKELIAASESRKDFPGVIKYYQKYFELEKSPATLDYYYYGQANYSAASKYIDPSYTATIITPEQKAIDEVSFQTFINNGNTAFTEVISRSPDSHLGYMWRANLHTLVDFKSQTSKGAPIQGVAKPYFEEAIDVMLRNNEDGRRNKDLISAYNYLASFYLLKEDVKNSGEYYKKIIEIDPTNADAKRALDAMKIKY